MSHCHLPPTLQENLKTRAHPPSLHREQILGWEEMPGQSESRESESSLLESVKFARYGDGS